MKTKNKEDIFKTTLNIIRIMLTIIAILIAINEIFRIGFFCEYILLGKAYYFIMMALLIPMIFLYFPLKKGKYIWLDTGIFIIGFIFLMYLAYNGLDILVKGYGFYAPIQFVVISLFIWFLILEGVRRSNGNILASILLFFSLYPIIAPYMPSFLYGTGRSIDKISLYHILGNDSVTGSLFGIYTSIIFGYILFGQVITFTGGPDFLMNISKSLLSNTRGGPAKMAVISSALFGSINGHPLINVITTGNVTIPAMKKSGYPAYYAAAIEAVASTGGTLTPPVMGATAFLLASINNISYPKVALAAAIPAILFYLTLFIQIDGYAAKHLNLGNLNEAVRPIKDVLKEGWYFLPTVIVLLYSLFFKYWVSQAPYLASACCLILSQTNKHRRLNKKILIKFLDETGKSLAILAVIMAGIGFVMGSFSLTGIAQTFSRGLFLLAGGNIYLMLIFAAVTSLIMGMGMPVVACYVFLAIIVGPSLVNQGLDRLAVHLFILYNAMIAYITPPVAMASQVASSIAKSSPMKTGFTAVRLGIALFFIPFFFVLNPVLILQGSPLRIFISFITASFGLFLLGSALEGYCIFIGIIQYNYFFRVILGLIGILLVLPDWKVNLATILIFVPVIFMYRKINFSKVNKVH